MKALRFSYNYYARTILHFAAFSEHSNTILFPLFTKCLHIIHVNNESIYILRVINIGCELFPIKM